MINNTSNSITIINVACKQLTLPKTYFTYNITTDMIINILEENTIDKSNALTMAYVNSLSFIFFPVAFISFVFLMSSMNYFFMKFYT